MYDALYRWGLLKELTAHMSRKDSNRLRYVYAIQLGEEVYYGLSADPAFRLNQHSTEGTESVRKLIKRGATLKVLSPPLPPDAASKLERLLIEQARRAGRRTLNATFGGELGGYVRVWTPDAIAKEASKYRSRNEFQRGCKAAYNAAYRMKTLNEVCGHMALRRVWSDQCIAEEALKYQARTLFARGSPSAYFTARKLGIIDAVCSHMSAPKTHGRRRLVSA